MHSKTLRLGRQLGQQLQPLCERCEILSWRQLGETDCAKPPAAR